MEDVIVGMWVEKVNITNGPLEYVHSLKYCQFGCIEDYITAHYQSPRQMLCLWNNLRQFGKTSCCNGHLSDGTIITVKQLSAKSKQGNCEFVNEIGMISALQHPHLVKLHGCCIEGVVFCNFVGVYIKAETAVAMTANHPNYASDQRHVHPYQREIRTKGSFD